MNSRGRSHPSGLGRRLRAVPFVLMVPICVAASASWVHAVNFGALIRALRVTEEGGRAAEGAAAAARAARAARDLEMAARGVDAVSSAARASLVFSALPNDAAHVVAYLGREADGVYVLIARGGEPALHVGEDLTRALDALDAGGTVPMDLYLDMPAAQVADMPRLHRPEARVFIVDGQAQAQPLPGGKNSLEAMKDVKDVSGMAGDISDYGLQSTEVDQTDKKAGDRAIDQSDAPIENTGKAEGTGPSLLWGVGGVALLAFCIYLSNRLLS